MTDHYFTAEPGSSERVREVSFSVVGRSFTLQAASGVFSAGRLDPGTQVLLKKADLPVGAEGDLLDLGCGYGPIACVLASVAPQATVWAVDVNARARELTEMNTKSMRVITRAPDEVPAEQTFRQIWSNPPIRIGKPELHELLAKWLPRLTPDGEAWLVVAKHLGSDSLAEWLREQGWLVERHASGSGFRVLKVTRSNRS